MLSIVVVHPQTLHVQTHHRSSLSLPYQGQPLLQDLPHHAAHLHNRHGANIHQHHPLLQKDQQHGPANPHGLDRL